MRVLQLFGSTLKLKDFKRTIIKEKNSNTFGHLCFFPVVSEGLKPKTWQLL
jgi:hypothetical protein